MINRLTTRAICLKLATIGNAPTSCDQGLFFLSAAGLGLTSPCASAPVDAMPATEMAREGFFAGDSHRSSNAEVAQALQLIKDEAGEDELFFDPRTGQLTVHGPGERPVDAMPATEMAREGFFAAPVAGKIAVVFEDEASLWLERAKASRGATGAIALELDEGVVHYALLPPAEWRRSGSPVPALALLSETGGEDPAKLEARGRRLAGNLPACAHLVELCNRDGTIGARSFSRRAGAWVEDQTILVPVGEVFSRNRGVLESNLLADRKVAIVGLGSGGATIAVELAMAGVGRFLLCDHDRLEVHNVGRHLCDLRDLGRLKTRAVRDRILARNPTARVDLLEGDITSDPQGFAAAVADCEVIVGATDNNRSRRLINRLAVERGVPAIFGRAFTRACGGDVIRVRSDGPCYECIVGSDDESAPRFLGGEIPAYSDRPAPVEPGLALDILPISMMCARLTLQELVRGSGSTLESLDDDLRTPIFIWANRREDRFADWKPMGATYRHTTVMRWYGFASPKRAGCPVCDEEGFLAGLEAEALGRDTTTDRAQA